MNVGKCIPAAILLFFIASVSATADEIHLQGVVLDGTMGTSQLELPGPDYEIKAEYGRQAGTNLFHSFQRFNIHSDETATFTGPDSVQNIISRVTGGESSWIDGTLRSTIPGADLWFLNPAGIMFGPNARLDLGGSFHAGTADYARFGENERFYARPSADDVLSVAPPKAFGFLNDDAAPISIKGKGRVEPETWDGNPAGLTVSEGETISLIGGDIDIRSGAFLHSHDEDTETWHDQSLGSLNAPSGRIRLVAVKSPGEMSLATPDPDMSRFERMADITVTDNSVIDVSGQGNGHVWIRGGNFYLDNSDILAETNGDLNGGMIDIQSETVSITGGGTISANTRGTGDGAEIRILASDTVTVAGEDAYANRTGITAKSLHDEPEIKGGDGGKVSIRSNDILFQDGANISVDSYGLGATGNIELRATESVLFTGESSEVLPSAIYLRSRSDYDNAGGDGALLVDAKNIRFEKGAFITAPTYGKGRGAAITLKASESVAFSGEASDGWNSAVFVTGTYNGEGAGDAGSLLIDAADILFEGGAYITANTYGKGNGGNVTLKASDSIVFDGEASDAWPSSVHMKTYSRDEGAGDGGFLDIHTKTLSFRDGAMISCTTGGKAGRATWAFMSMKR